MIKFGSVEQRRKDDEIRKLCEELIPKESYYKGFEAKDAIRTCNFLLFKALESGKLVRPLSVEEIFEILEKVNQNEYSQKCGWPTKGMHYARAIAKAQFRKG